MKKRLGSIMLWLSGAMAVYLIVTWTVTSLSFALRLMEPVVVVGGAIILALVGIFLRDEK